MPNTKMIPTPIKEPNKEAAINITTITPNNKKKLTTIFPRKKELTRVTMTKKKSLVAKEFPRVEDKTTSDEELLEATQVIEREEEEKRKQKEGAKYKVATVEAGRDAMAVKPPLEAERAGARPKVKPVVNRRVTAAKPPNQKNDSSDEEFLQATL